MTVIEVSSLRRTYRTRIGPWKRASREVEAVRGVDFAVERGELFGLLGPNGAGKTTTIKMLITLLLPTSGSARVLGHDVVEDPREVRRRVGYVFGGDRGLYERLSGLDNLRYFAELYGVPAREQKARIGELLELVGPGRPGEGAGRGLLAGHAAAAAHRPRPAAQARGAVPRRADHRHRPGRRPRAAHDRGRPGRNAGTTVLLTTHYMFEADELCDRIAVIAGGRIVAEGTPADLKSRVGDGTVVEVEVFGAAGSALPALRALAGVRSAVVEERGHAAGPRRAGRARRRGDPAGARLPGRDLGSAGSPPGEPTLEDAYVELVGVGVTAPCSIRPRLLAMGWWFQLKMRSRSAFDGILGVLWPLFFATIASPHVRHDGDDEALLYAAVGASVMGVWSAVSTIGQRLAAARALGRAPSSCWSPPRSRCRCVLLPITLAMATIGLYSMVATLLWGRFAVRHRRARSSTAAVRRSPLPSRWSSIGLMGFLLAVTVGPVPQRLGARQRAGDAGLADLRASWCRSASLPGLGPPDRVGCWRPPGGCAAIREAALGGNPLPDMLLCLARRRSATCRRRALSAESVLRLRPARNATLALT